MLPKIICIAVLVLFPQGLGIGPVGDEPSPEYRREDDDDSFGGYHQDNDEDTFPVRVKRLQAKATIKTLSPLEIQQVKGAIQQILSGHNQDNPFTPLPPRAFDQRGLDTRVQKPRSAQSPNEDRSDAITKFTEDTNVIYATDSEALTKESLSTDTIITTSTLTTNQDETEPNEDFTKSTVNALTPLSVIPGTDVIIPNTSASADEIVTENDMTKTNETIYYETETNTGATTNEMLLSTLPPIGRTYNDDITSDINIILNRSFHIFTTPFKSGGGPANITYEREPTTTIHTEMLPTYSEITFTPISEKDEIEETDSTEEADSGEDEEEDDSTTTTTKKSKKKTKAKKTKTITTTTTTTRKSKKKKKKTITIGTTTTRFKLDVPALLAIIANLTYDYEVNLTDKLNKTLLKYSVPTCETPTTTVKRGLFIDYDANATGTIVAKCFVCGLENYGIPRDAHCGDAFAGDFLPLMPMDMTARGRISKFRKYCRYADVPGIMKNMSQPRSVFGRWSGGCSVRWIDLSNVYTQRSCRNRERAIMGKNFASKRMAKLEMALKHVDNGCIASPMATLVPLSRGISLYARFHACVCTGSWCNAADLRVPWTTALLMTFLACISPWLIT